MDKQELLKLLEDAEVRQKIFSIAAGKEPPPLKPDADADLNEALTQIQQLKIELTRADQRASNLQTKLLEVENSAREHRLRADQLAQTYQEKFNRLQDSENRAKRRESQLQSSIKQLQEKLEERFGRGWELFQKYRFMGGHARNILSASVFPRDDFTSFICSAAQTTSLEIIWDTAKECTFTDQPRDAELLWQIFEYAVALVNSAKAQTGYSILPVAIGDRFDPDFHAEGPNSRAQGIVAHIYIAGYKNNYSGKIIRKSVVQVS